MLCANFGCKCTSVSEEEDLKFWTMYFYYFAITPLWEGRDPSLEKKLNHFHPKMLCGTFGWKRPRFLKVLHVLLLFHNYLPFEKGVVLHLIKLEFPSPKNVLCKDWWKLVQWFWRRKCFKNYQINFIISQLSPLWKGRGPSFEQTWIPFTQGYFVPSLVETGPVVLEKIFKSCEIIFFSQLSILLEGRIPLFVQT